MNRAQLIDILSAVVVFLIVAAVVASAGGPSWASAGFGLMAYLHMPPRAQLREAKR